MEWEKKGKIFEINGQWNWAKTHTHKPTPIVLNDRIRVYYGSRDKFNVTRTSFIDVDLENPSKLIYAHDKPVLDVGELGMFDDAGVNASTIVAVDEKLYLYYIAWNPSKTVPTRNSIGLAISEDGGVTFNKIKNVPVLDRNHYDPFYIGANFVLRNDGKWLTWYTSGKCWKMINGKPEIWYRIRFADSSDGISWEVKNRTSIHPNDEFECTARPSVYIEDGLYKMFFSIRNMIDFRLDSNNSYRIGYAESKDGINWIRKDKEVGITVSENGWDSEMIAYPAILKIDSKLIMFYNGNNFGESGIGYAILNN